MSYSYSVTITVSYIDADGYAHSDTFSYSLPD
jgi:hypothetical protein